TTDPTPLAEQIAREHWLQWRTGNSVSCASCPMPETPVSGVTQMLLVERAHIATVTERAVREQMRPAGPSLEIQAWGATPEQADAIVTAAMDAAYAAAPEHVAVDAVGKLVGRAANGAPDA